MSFLPEKIREFFRLSDIPSRVREILEQEGILFLAEGIRVSAFYRRFKAPGKSFRNKRETSWGALGISRKRIIGYALRRRIIHLPLDSPQIGQVKFSLVEGKVLVIDADPSISDPRRSGSMEIRFHTGKAEEAYRLIMDLTGS